jgi:hypothetical protein
LSVPDFGQIRRRLEQLGASLSTSLYSINLGTQDSETGQYGLYYSLSSIDAIIQPNPAVIENTKIGYYPVHVATMYTSTQINEGDIIKDAAGDWYTVKTVSPIELGDGIILYNGELASRFAYLCPAGNQVTNGGFETGDLTGWVNDGAAADPYNYYSGSYGCWLGYDGCTGTSDSITQTFSAPIPAYCITELSLYEKMWAAGGTGYYVKIDVTYTDTTSDTISKETPSAEYDTWVKQDFTSGLDTTKFVSSIKIYVDGCDHSIDDVVMGC